MNDLVSVVVPVYNSEEDIFTTLQSVFDQTYSNLEIVVVDDGSTDDSLAILRRLGDRIVLVSQKNGGAAAARNRGAREASGKWIAFLDADDVWAPDKIEAQMNSMGDACWSYTDCVFAGGVNDGRRDSEFSEKLSGMIFDKLILSNFIGTSSVLVCRDVYLASGGFDESLCSIEDWELWLRLAKEHPITYLDQPTVRYRVRPGSMSRSSRRNLPNHLKVIDSMFSEGGLAHEKRALKKVALANSYSICSHIAEEEGDHAYAASCALRAGLLQPFSPSRWLRAGKSVLKYAISLVSEKSVMNCWLMVVYTGL